MAEYRYDSFAYHASSPIADYQLSHQQDHGKHPHPVALSPVGQHWPHYPGTCQCLAGTPQCTQPAFAYYGYANQWVPQNITSSVPMLSPTRAHPHPMHAGPVYTREHAFHLPVQPLEAGPLYGPQPPVHGGYRASYIQGDKSKHKSAQNQFGPPQKPLQSRYALWVGGISSDTDVLQLRDHFFVPEVAGDILSVVLMPRSHSGFVNFRTARSCKAAAYRFNNTTLNGAFLKCRCRRPSSEADGSVSNFEVASVSSHQTAEATPTSATESTFSLHTSDEDTPNSSSCSESPPQNTEQSSVVGEEDQPAHQQSSRYFVIKSLTHEELVASVNSGRWATQSQNEATLNKAYQTSDAVYLIFSMNRSGEFFGYARMDSPISSSSSSPAAPAPQSPQATAKPATFAASNSYQTPAKGLVPSGRVVDELYRGKVFWELGRELWTPVDVESCEEQAEAIASFKVDWISVRRLPFWQTKHLLNAWNENKPVKVGRDGTELETEAGRKLCELFLGPAPGKAR